MIELDFIADIVEEKIAKGGLRWMASFSEIHRNYTIGDINAQVYAKGNLRERGFLFSRFFSSVMTPRYGIQFLLYTANFIDVKLLRKIVLSCKNKFGPDDWIFVELVQTRPIDKALSDAVRNIADNRVGVVASSLASKEQVSSENTLGKNLKRQLKLTEARFEAFDAPSYLKSFGIMSIFGIMFLLSLQIFLSIPAVTLPSVLLIFAFGALLGYPVYKSRYHTVLTLNDKGFEIFKGGKSKTQGKWAAYSDVAIYVAPNNESFLRLYSKNETLDLPISRVGISRKDAYNAIQQLIRGS